MRERKAVGQQCSAGDAATSRDSAARPPRRLSVTGPVRAAPALLIDDTLRSGFTMTAAAAALLRAGGAGPVYPLVLYKLV